MKITNYIALFFLVLLCACGTKDEVTPEKKEPEYTIFKPITSVNTHLGTVVAVYQKDYPPGINNTYNRNGEPDAGFVFYSNGRVDRQKFLVKGDSLLGATPDYKTVRMRVTRSAGDYKPLEPGTFEIVNVEFKPQVNQEDRNKVLQRFLNPTQNKIVITTGYENFNLPYNMDYIYPYVTIRMFSHSSFVDGFAFNFEQQTEGNVRYLSVNLFPYIQGIYDHKVVKLKLIKLR